MGISAGGGGDLKSDINVTPLVDVVLVMLIIFMVAMPIQIRKIALEVPRELEADVISVSKATVVTIRGQADGSLIINEGAGDTVITRVELAKTMNQIFTKAGDDEKVVFVDFEDPVKYLDVVSVMDTVRGAAPKKRVELADGTARMDPDVKVALKIRDEDRQKK